MLRERRPTAYEDLIRKFLEAATGGELKATRPWLRLLLKGEAPTRGAQCGHAEVAYVVRQQAAQDRADQRLLEESVRGILRRENEWRGSAAAQRAIEKAESDLRDLEGDLARVERDLRAFREAETHSHELPGGYSGTAAQIAHALLEQEGEFGWFPGLPADAAFPLDPSESGFLAESHSCFTADARAELELEVGAAEFSGPDEFKALIARLMAAEESAQQASRGADAAKLELLEQGPPERLRELREAVQALTDLARRPRVG